MSTMRLPALAGRGIVLELDPEAPDALLGLDEGAADVMIPDDAQFEGNSGFPRVAMAAGTPESGTGTITSAGTGASRANCSPKPFRTHKHNARRGWSQAAK